jgi:hypothetical protein
MPGKKKPGPSVKNPDTYEALRDDGASKEKAARISNAQANQGKKVSQKGGQSGSYEDWSVDKLRKRAGEIGIDGRSKMNKGELVKALRNH